MLQNAYFLAKIGADTAENEQRFAEILPTDALCVRPDGTVATGSDDCSIKIWGTTGSALLHSCRLLFLGGG